MNNLYEQGERDTETIRKLSASMHFISTSFINSKKSVVFMLQSQICKNVKFAQRGKNTLFWFYFLWIFYTTDRIRLVPITVQARISTNPRGLETSTNVHKSLGTGDQHELPLGLENWRPARTSAYSLRTGDQHELPLRLENWGPARTFTNLEDWKPLSFSVNEVKRFKSQNILNFSRARKLKSQIKIVKIG